MSYETHMPSILQIGGGSKSNIGAVAARFGIKKALLVSDKFIESTGVTTVVSDILKSSGVESVIFTDINNEPETGNVNNALLVLKQADCDGVISLGGGSCIDTAKAVSVLALNDGEISDYMGIGKVPGSGLVHIAVPTTAGTGSEVTRVTIVTDPVKNIKMMCLDDAFLPSAAIVDYELSMTMPKKLTAYVGIDALTHAIEAYVSRKANPVSDIFAEKAISLINSSILEAFSSPDDKSARAMMMEGATFAGIAFSNASVCAVHGMSRPIGAYFHVAHGLSNAMLLAVVTENSVSGNPERYSEISRIMKLGGSEQKELIDNLISRLYELNSLMNIPGPTAYGIERDKYFNLIPDMADAAIASGSPSNNPKLFSKEEIAELYKKVYDA